MWLIPCCLCTAEMFDFHSYINPAYPHLGALPDGIVSYDCCGEGVVEIKCPYNDVENIVSLEQSADGLHLK